MDLLRLSQSLGGIGIRLRKFAQGNLGQVFNATTPDIDLVDVVKRGTMVYVALPPPAEGQLANVIGKIIASDLRAAVTAVQALPADEQTNIPFARFDYRGGSKTLAPPNH
jgi:hypothetical protein